VNVIPLVDHHDIFCAEDIEIWQLTRQKQLETHCSASPGQCILSSWGEGCAEIPVLLDGLQLTIHQTPTQTIGGMLWPSSVVATR
jgi:hypothetical protein